MDPTQTVPLTPEQLQALYEAAQSGRVRWVNGAWVVDAPAETVEPAPVVAPVITPAVTAAPSVVKQSDGIIAASFDLSVPEFSGETAPTAITVDGVLPNPCAPGTVPNKFRPNAKRHNPDDLSEYVVDAIMRIESSLWDGWDTASNPQYAIRWTVTRTRYDSSSGIAGWSGKQELNISLDHSSYRHLRYWGTLAVDQALEICGYGSSFSSNQLRGAMKRAEERGWLEARHKAGHSNTWSIKQKNEG